MGSHVVVIDTSARRTTVKVTPQTYLSDVLQQACTKFSRKPEQWGLKYNKKQVDLSLTFRLSGLPSGAQLEFVQSSRSPAVINVALQFPQSENNLRLTEKFPSSTSLWQILRRFESGTAGGAPYPLNITQRGAPQTANGNSGSGRMMYEMPTLTLMNRELGSFLELQKTLAQLGVTSGSALFRLNFKNSGQPLEEAMLEISQYFKEEEQLDSSSQLPEAHVAPPASQTSTEAAGISAPKPATITDSNDTSAPPESMEDVVPSPQNKIPELKVEEGSSSGTTTSTTAATAHPSPPAIAVFSAPTSTPAAVSLSHNEADYIPTIDHAKSHQARLETLGQNKRLLSDRELDEQRREREARAKAVQSIRVRFRMPDQTQVQVSLGRDDTVATLFATVRQALRHAEQPFTLSYRDAASGRHTALSRSGSQKLIQGLGWTGDTLVNVSWGEPVPDKVRREPVLKDAYLAQATQMKVEQPKEQEEEEPEEEGRKGGFFGGLLGKGDAKAKGKEKAGSTADKEARLMKMMGFGKK